MPPRPSFRHAFTRRLYALDPITCRLSPELRGHIPSVDFCNFRDPRARPPIRQTPPHLRWQATARRAAPPPKGRHQPDSHSSGVYGIPKDPRHPPRRPHAKTDLPQPASSGHLLSLADTLRGLEQAMKSDRTEVGLPLRRATEPGPRAEARGPCRAASYRPSRKRR